MSGRVGLDPRAGRFAAAVTAVLLAVVLLLGSGTVGTALLAAAVASFAVGTVRGVRGTWQAALYRRVVRPRLGPPAALEDPAPPRFAQGVGLVITGAGLLLAVLGVPGAVEVAAGLALVAALLNAVAGVCLGCELYLVLHRVRRSV